MVRFGLEMDSSSRSQEPSMKDRVHTGGRVEAVGVGANASLDGALGYFMLCFSFSFFLTSCYFLLLLFFSFLFYA